jgi:hypothetical protein
LYKLRYGRNFNLGNYESERIEIEREFSNTVPSAQAVLAIEKEIEADRKALIEARNGGKLNAH